MSILWRCGPYNIARVEILYFPATKMLPHGLSVYGANQMSLLQGRFPVLGLYPNSFFHQRLSAEKLPTAIEFVL